ncbi:MAG TPA: antibiotic biosynthesis monooxygenase family protein [Cyclobacteriaceae bacterium]|nr:antibiotic biosynthesis monooxygenase family protein [Cyclobacteriaceae bacterium]
MANPYLLHGQLTAVVGQQEALAEILIEASQLLSKVKGCRLYVISKEASEPQAVYITEIWDSKEDHDLSLNDEGVKALIMKAMPLLDGPPSKGQELEVWGGLGI